MSEGCHANTLVSGLSVNLTFARTGGDNLEVVKIPR